MLENRYLYEVCGGRPWCWGPAWCVLCSVLAPDCENHTPPPSLARHSTARHDIRNNQTIKWKRHWLFFLCFCVFRGNLLYFIDSVIVRSNSEQIIIMLVKKDIIWWSQIFVVCHPDKHDISVSLAPGLDKYQPGDNQSIRLISDNKVYL